MRAKFGCLVAVMGMAVGAWAVELVNGAEFAMDAVPAEAKAELPKGGSIRFLLEENATTGYEWTAAFSSNEVEVVIEHREPLVNDGRCGVPGVAAVKATLKGKDAAPVLIEMKYVRPWEKDSPAETMRIVLYKVKDGITSSNYPESRTLAMLGAEPEAWMDEYVKMNPQVLKLAKEMGAKFSFGSNNYDAAPKDLSRWLEVTLWLDLKAGDIWQPADLKPL